VVKWLKPQLKEKTIKKFPTEEEILRIVQATINQRDRAFIFNLYESGARINEWLHVRFGDIEFKNNTAIITIRVSKTKQRKIVLIKSFLDFKLWLQQHTDPKQDNYVWSRLEDASERLRYSTVQKMIRRLSNRAGVPYYSPHKFRHARAKTLEKVLLTREKMNYFGWSSVEMVQTYGEFTDDEVINTVLANERMLELEERKDLLKNLVCPHCKGENPASAKFCYTCSTPLDGKIAIQY
jgi:integrase